MTKITRRNFIKLLGLGLLATQVPIGLERVLLPYNYYPHFNPKHKYGDAIGISDFFEGLNDPWAVEAYSIFSDQIKKAIPPGFRSKIQWIWIPPAKISGDPLCQRTFIGWEYSPNN